jgi:arylsulfatase A-like enzyme
MKLSQTILILSLIPILSCKGKQAEKPNILFIFTDQQHAGMLSVTGNENLKTPNLDVLANKGVRFEKAYSTNPVCIPSRFSMLTGTLPSTIGMEANEDRKKPVPESIMQHAMGNLFHNAGYETVYGGKIHLPGPGEIFEDVQPYGFEYITNDFRYELANKASEFLKQDHDKPFLLVTSFINPHDICYYAINEWSFSVQGRSKDNPIGKGSAWEELSKALEIPDSISVEEFVTKNCPQLPDNFNIPENELSTFMSDKPEFMHWVRNNWTEIEWRLHRWAYARLTEQVDDQIGVVLQTLKETGLDKNTLIIFTSDHGDQDGSHSVEHKAFLYEESVRVPFFISGPGISPKVDNTSLVMTGLDILPTMLDYAGIEIPPALQGKSLLPILKGKTNKKHREFLISENHMSRMVFDGRWKYIAGRSEKHEDGCNCKHCQEISSNSKNEVVEMLIDLENDPGEMHNLALNPKYRDQLEKNRKRLVRWYQKHDFVLDEKYIW